MSAVLRMNQMSLSRVSIAAVTFVVITFLTAPSAKAGNFSFVGTFTQDDNVQLFNFTLSASAIVTFRTYSYAGGTNANGMTILRGGFDPNLALFNSATTFLLIQNDNGVGVATDPATSRAWDSLQTINLPAGNYTLALTESNNFAVGPSLTNGFTRQGQGNFTGSRDARCLSGQFVDASNVSPGDCRDGNWAVDILNVTSAQRVGGATPVPEPASILLMISGFAGIALKIRRRHMNGSKSR